ncbi:MAG: L-fucose isomerase (FucIase) [uncultured Truepera sp.]|uniref:L-fucose isomerase (FucIase) n=1 Tax=uncultured Truepera sp. TaxID=543023 RepID=A0A6J4UZ16_9DEIN|nr:MAG: L-fucose isomerase (FucIase) [uncultured Truepera sp.]
MTALPLTLPIPHAYLVASGDLRLSANRTCWPAQRAMEEKLTTAFAAEGVTLTRAHPYDPGEQHGFISSQRMGMDVFKRLPKDVPVVVAEAVWQYSHHVLAGLRDHKAPILTVANWSGQYPGLVGLLNLNGSLTKAGIPYSTLWSEDFTDDFFLSGLRTWLQTGALEHDQTHVKPLAAPSGETAELGQALARQLKDDKAIIGVFDEGCMGMYNAIIDDELLNALGIYKERLSQSALLAEMERVTGEEADGVRSWLEAAGMTFKTGSDEATELTDAQLHGQFKMYIAALRIAERFGCNAIGIQYQQGLNDMAPASDLVEGLLNNPERPPAYHAETGSELYAGLALPHFNEVDECAAVDALVTNQVWLALGIEPSTTLHDIRWGEVFHGESVSTFVWTLMISGAAPASHFGGGYAGATSERQVPMFFPKGGGTLKGVSKPGEIVWSRVYIEDQRLKADLGLGRAVALPDAETNRRWGLTDSQWPIMHAVLYGVSRDGLMSKHKANHIQVAYAPSAAEARRALATKAAMFQTLGLEVFLCGDVMRGDS